jgi:two-component system, OmpR family, sensor kinase
VSLRLRLLGAFAYVLLLLIVALEVPLALNLARRVHAEVKNGAANQAHVVAASASGQMGHPDELERIARRSALDLGARVIIVGPGGALRADSAGTGLVGRSYASRPEIRTALRGSSAQVERHSQTLGEDGLFTAVPVTNAGRVVGAVRVTQSIGEVDRRVRRAVLALVAIGAFALALGLGIAWFLAGSFSRPLRSLARTARRVEEGDLEARAQVEGPAEQREVALAFNDMTERMALVLGAQREFVANASHQLRTPLTGLRLRLESAAGKTSDPELERELAAAEQEVERLARLLNALLMLAREGQRPTTGRLVSMGLAAARAHERWVDRAEQRGQRLELTGGEDVVVHASEEELAIMLDNLIENALHYSPAEARIDLEFGRDDHEAFVAVLDEGPGVTKGEEQTLFERFARGSTSSGAPAGTGLGLAIVQTLANRWRGRASLRQRPEGGTRAEVRLPVASLPKANPELEESLDDASYTEP